MVIENENRLERTKLLLHESELGLMGLDMDFLCNHSDVATQECSKNKNVYLFVISKNRRNENGLGRHENRGLLVLLSPILSMLLLLTY